MLPKVPRLLSAETETMPKVLKSTLLAPKPKRKPKFGRSLLLVVLIVVGGVDVVVAADDVVTVP